VRRHRNFEIGTLVIGGSTDPVSQVANFSHGKSVSIDKWM